MSGSNALVPGELRSGLQALVSLGGCELLGEPLFLSSETVWALQLRLTIPCCSAFVPKATDWYMLIDLAYPMGRVMMYPSKSNGLTATFHHQDQNAEGPASQPWRSGKLCLDRPITHFGSRNEPFGDAEARLRWHVERTLSWLQSAAKDELIKNGEPFELPHLKPIGDGVRVVHDEDPSSYDIWRNCSDELGLAELIQYQSAENTLLVVSFKRLDGQILRSSFQLHPEGGAQALRKTVNAVWWRWPAPMVLEPWAIPLTWGELRHAALRYHLNADHTLQQVARLFRNARASILLIGYDIPMRFGQQPSEMHWQAVSLPEMKDKSNVPNGFRANDSGFWQRDRYGLLGSSVLISYLPTENWHSDRLQSRGRIEGDLRSMRAAIIGLGSLGSSVCELLARSGMSHFLLIDNDSLVAGNLVRHSLTMREVGKLKAKEIVRRISAISPSIYAKAETEAILGGKQHQTEKLGEYQLVIDCTGSDEVLIALAREWQPIPRLFISASVSYRAQKVFVYGALDHSFPYESFRKSVAPFLTQEDSHEAIVDETLEGAGCWSPLFPARLDDIWLAAVATVKTIEEFAASKLPHPRLMVFENSRIGNQFIGLQRIKE